MAEIDPPFEPEIPILNGRPDFLFHAILRGDCILGAFLKFLRRVEDSCSKQISVPFYSCRGKKVDDWNQIDDLLGVLA
mgnify:CR=1 FL=1